MKDYITGGLRVHTLITQLIRRHCAELIICSLTFSHKSLIMTYVMWKSLTRSAANEEMWRHCRVKKNISACLCSLFKAVTPRDFLLCFTFPSSSVPQDQPLALSLSNLRLSVVLIVVGLDSGIAILLCSLIRRTARIRHTCSCTKYDGHSLSSAISCLDMLM